jgi:hypothetical protein
MGLRLTALSSRWRVLEHFAEYGTWDSRPSAADPPVAQAGTPRPSGASITRSPGRCPGASHQPEGVGDMYVSRVGAAANQAETVRAHHWVVREIAAWLPRTIGRRPAQLYGRLSQLPAGDRTDCPGRAAAPILGIFGATR